MIFVGNDEESTKLTRSIDQEDVSKLLGSNHFVSIKIQANTVPHQQFSEICILFCILIELISRV